MVIMWNKSFESVEDRILQRRVKKKVLLLTQNNDITKKTLSRSVTASRRIACHVEVETHDLQHSCHVSK